MAEAQIDRLLGALSSRFALQTLLECPWALKGQCKAFPEGKRAHTHPPLTAETRLQTMQLLAGQLTVYTDGYATAGTRDGSAGLQ